jgi:hypothetical protein
MKEARTCQKSSENVNEKEWEQVSLTYMNGLRSASECRKRWLFLTKSQGQKHLWSEAESKLLNIVAEDFLENGKPRFWKSICEKYNERAGKSKPQRSARQCREHWMNKLDPKLDNSKFSIKEEVRMLELLKKHGRSNWHKIAADINRERGKNCLQRNEI